MRGGARRARRGVASRSVRRRPGRGRAPRGEPILAGGARMEVRQDLVNHRRLRDERDDPHGAVAPRAREGASSKICCKSAVQRRAASVDTSFGATAIGTGGSATVGSAWRRSLGADWHTTGNSVWSHGLCRGCGRARARETPRGRRSRCRWWAFRLIGAIHHRLRGPVVRQPLQRYGMPRALPREAGREGPIVLGDPHSGVHVAPRMLPGELAGGLAPIEQL